MKYYLINDLKLNISKKKKKKNIYPRFFEYLFMLMSIFLNLY